MAYIGKTPTPAPLTSGDIPDLPATKITSGTFPALNGSNLTNISAGKILQVEQSSLTSEVSTTSASYVTSGLSATLTPASSSNKILILLNGGRISYGDSSGNRMAVTFYYSIGGATASDILGSNPVANMSLLTGDSGYTWQHSGSFLYSPSTTSSVAITVYFKAIGDLGQPVFNHTSQSITPRVTLTLMEVSA